MPPLAHWIASLTRYCMLFCPLAIVYGWLQAWKSPIKYFALAVTLLAAVVNALYYGVDLAPSNTRLEEFTTVVAYIQVCSRPSVRQCAHVSVCAKAVSCEALIECDVICFLTRLNTSTVLPCSVLLCSHPQMVCLLVLILLILLGFWRMIAASCNDAPIVKLLSAADATSKPAPDTVVHVGTESLPVLMSNPMALMRPRGVAGTPVKKDAQSTAPIGISFGGSPSSDDVLRVTANPMAGAVAANAVTTATATAAANAATAAAAASAAAGSSEAGDSVPG